MNCPINHACISALLFLVTIANINAQSFDPALREDAAIERQKILKSADQLDLIVNQNQQLQSDLVKLKQEIAILQQRLADLESNTAKDKQALLKEVAAIVASKPTTPKPEVKEEKVSPLPLPKQEGFEYEVKAGDNLWAIAKAYQEAGVKVSAEELRRVNQLDKSQNLKTGQKLFIPKN